MTEQHRQLPCFSSNEHKFWILGFSGLSDSSQISWLLFGSCKNTKDALFLFFFFSQIVLCKSPFLFFEEDKKESEKVGLKLDIQKTKLMASGSISSWEIDGETVSDFILGGSKITADGDCSHEIKTLTPWKKSYDQAR